jgi:hypothetical protein
MRRRPTVLALIAALSAAGPAAASDGWSIGAGRGGIEAAVDNVRDGSFAIACPAGTRRLELVLEVRRPGPRTPGDPVAVAFGVDGRDHGFPFRVAAALPTSATLVWQGEAATLAPLLDALRRGRSLDVRIADLPRIERFPLRGSSVAIDRVEQACRHG